MTQPELWRSRTLLAGALLVGLNLPGCSRLRRELAEPPTASATEPAVIAGLPLPPDSPEPPTEPPTTPDVYGTFQAEVMATLMAAASATVTAVPTGPAVVGTAALPVVGPEPGCAIYKQPLGLNLRVDPAAPQPTPPAAAYFDRYSVEVLEHRPDARLYRLAALEPRLAFNLELGYTGEPLPAALAPGARLRVEHYDDLHLRQPAGEGVLVEDEAGLLVLGVNVRETDGADGRILGGARGGWTVQQLATACRYAPVNACGFEERAVPVRFRSPDGMEQVLSPGDQATMAAPGRPTYRILLANSHVRLWRSDLPCADASDWVLSYRIQRENANAPASPAP